MYVSTMILKPSALQKVGFINYSERPFLLLDFYVPLLTKLFSKSIESSRQPLAFSNYKNYKLLCNAQTKNLKIFSIGRVI
jgi:hypothetical protein